MAEAKLLYRVPEAAAALGLSRVKVYELMGSGKLGSVKIDGSRRIPAQDLARFVDRLRAGNGDGASDGHSRPGESAA
ncbi:MAG: helix-turn-helix domain-containing protein [Xanthobacteraceae bacterium]